MTCTRDALLSPGGNSVWAAPLRSADGSAIDLTGFSASIVDVTGVLAGAVSVSIADAVAGVVRIVVTWQGAWPVNPGLLGTFRLSLVSATQEIVTEPTPVYVQGISTTLTIARGCDMTYPFTWPDDREGADLTGEALDVINASGTLAPLVTVEVLDADTRACRLHVEGDLAVPIGAAGTFQLRRRIGSADPRTLPPVAVTFK